MPSSRTRRFARRCRAGRPGLGEAERDELPSTSIGRQVDDERLDRRVARDRRCDDLRPAARIRRVEVAVGRGGGGRGLGGARSPRGGRRCGRRRRLAAAAGRGRALAAVRRRRDVAAAGCRRRGSEVGDGRGRRRGRAAAAGAERRGGRGAAASGASGAAASRASSSWKRKPPGAAAGRVDAREAPGGRGEGRGAPGASPGGSSARHERRAHRLTTWSRNAARSRPRSSRASRIRDARRGVAGHEGLDERVDRRLIGEAQQVADRVRRDRVRRR